MPNMAPHSPPRAPARAAPSGRSVSYPPSSSSPSSPASSADEGRAQFEDLLRRLAAHEPALAGVHLREGAPFTCGRLLVGLSHAGELAPGRVIVHVDLDDLVAQIPSATLYPTLLAANHDGCLQGRGYCLSRDSRHVLYSESLDMDELPAARLVAEIQRICEGVERLVLQCKERARP